MNKMLLDTGALVALLDRSERNHARCVQVLQRFHGRLLTTEPVLTETVYLLGPSFHNQDPALRFFLQGGAELVPMTPARLARARELMERYADVPMDLADATLVALAEEIGVHDVFTLDRRGFSVYRTSRHRAFRIVP